MTAMREGAVRCLDPHGFHWMRYTDWGDAANPRVLVCVHGLTRNSRDFDALAVDLASRCRVVCVDLVGRGASDWLEPETWPAAAATCSAPSAISAAIFRSVALMCRTSQATAP